MKVIRILGFVAVVAAVLGISPSVSQGEGGNRRYVPCGGTACSPGNNECLVIDPVTAPVTGNRGGSGSSFLRP